MNDIAIQKEVEETRTAFVYGEKICLNRLDPTC